MKKIFLILSYISLSLGMAAQSFESRSYDWEARPQAVKLSDDELKEPAVLLKDKRIVEYLYTGKNDLNRFYTRHKIIRINEDKALESYNKIYLPIRKATDLLVFKARTISRSGKIIEMSKDNMKEVDKDGTNYLILAVDGLETGGILEYFYSWQTGPTFFGTEYFQSETMLKDGELTIISPENLKFEARSYNGFPAFRDSVGAGKRFLSGMISKTVPMYEEKSSAYQANLARVEYKLVANTAGGESRLFTWADAGKRFFEIYYTADRGTLKQVRKLADELKLRGMPQEDKIRAVENYIKTNINIKEDYGSGQDIETLLKNKYGSESELVKLYSAIFEELQVPYQVVLTSNRFTTPFDGDFDTWTYLENYLLYFPDSKKYIAPVNYDYRYGQPPFIYRANQGLFIKTVTLGETRNGAGAVKRIEESTKDENYENMDVKVEFSDNMDQANMNIKRIFKGYCSQSYRPYYFYQPEEDRKKLVEEMMKSITEDIRLSNTKVLNFNLNSPDNDKEFIVETDAASGSLLEKASDAYLFKVGELIGRQTEMYQEKPRQTPVDAAFPHSYERILRIRIPKGYKVKGLENLNMNTAFEDKGKETMAFRSAYELKDNELTIKVNEFYGRTTYPLAQFENFRKVINSAADFNKLTLVFSK